MDVNELREKVIRGTCESVKGASCRFPRCLAWPEDLAFARCDSRKFAADTAIRIVAEACVARLWTKAKQLPHDHRWQQGMQDACTIIRALIPEEPTDV